MIFPDKDIDPVLNSATNEELGVLVELIEDSVSEELTSYGTYQKYYPDHKKYAFLISHEIRLFGGNSIANIFRNKGPSYAEIVADVAANVGAAYHSGASVPVIEDAIMIRLGTIAWENMTPEQRKEWIEGLGLQINDVFHALPIGFIQRVLNGGGNKCFNFVLSLALPMIEQVLGKAAVAGIAGFLGGRAAAAWFGPIGWAIAGAWAVVDIAGPAYRVTRPAVCYIAALRRKPATAANPYRRW